MDRITVGILFGIIALMLISLGAGVYAENMTSLLPAQGIELCEQLCDANGGIRVIKLGDVGIHTTDEQ